MIHNIKSIMLNQEYDQHLTPTEKRVIEYIIDHNMMESVCKSGRTQYYVGKMDARYTVIITRAERQTIGETPKHYARRFVFERK